MINTQIKAFEKQLVDLINGVPLPVSVKEIVVENVYLKLVNASGEAIKAEQEAIGEKQNQKENQELCD